jgi:lysyl-tRNA synthetase class II
LNSQHHDVAEQVNEVDELVKSIEEISPSTKDLQDIQSNVNTIRHMMMQANESNIELHRHMTSIIEHMKIISSPLEQLEKSLPIISELDGKHVN